MPARTAANTVTALEQAVQTAPTLANRIDLSQAYIHEKIYGKAVNLLEPLTLEAPGNVVVWNNLCVARALQQELNLALEACTKGVKVDGSFELIRNNLKWAQAEREKVLQALHSEQAVGPRKRDEQFYLDQGLNYLHIGDYKQAELSWQKVLQVQPGSALAWNNIGTAQMMQKHYREALASFQKAQALDSQNTLFLNNVAWARSTLQQGE